MSGASATESKAAMLQFGQALGSGKLQGDEFRSLMENALYLMQKLAQGLGVPIGALKALSTQGKLTSDVVVNALTKSADKIEADFAKFPQTVGDAFQVTSDAAGRANEKFDELTGTSTALTGITKGAGLVFDELAKQFDAANTGAGKLGRNDAVESWATKAKVALSYVADAADGVGRGFRVLGTYLTGLVSAAGSAMKGEFSESRDVLSGMLADIKSIMNPKYSGAAMREAWASGKPDAKPARPDPSRLKPPVGGDDKEARQLAARAQAAQAYYEGLVADNATALGKIDAEERKAVAENQKRAALDKNNQDVYAKARVEITKKYAKERALLEEKTTSEVADLSIAITTDQDAKISSIEAEAIRRATAGEKLKTLTHDEAERAKTLATFQAEQARKAIQEGVAQTNADTMITSTVDEMTKIDLIRQEGIRRATAAYDAGAISYEQAEANKVKASAEAQDAIRQKLLSIDPIRQLEQEYQQKLSIVATYEAAMAQKGIDATAFLEAKKAELTEQYRLQRLALAEQEFSQQGAANKLLMDSLNGMANSASSAISGLIIGTATAQDLMRGLASTVLNEAVSALVQMGLQYVKNAIISQAASTAMATAQTAAIATTTTAQIAATTTMAATSVASAGAVTAAAAPAAGLMSVATLGQAALIGGAALIGTMALAKSFGGNRRYGGPATAGNAYRINEGGQPEMFTAANGDQYMMPNTSGQVTPAGQTGLAAQMIVNVINNHPSAQVSSSMDQTGRVAEIVISEIASQFSSNTGKVWNSLKGSSNVRGAGF